MHQVESDDCTYTFFGTFGFCTHTFLYAYIFSLRNLLRKFLCNLDLSIDPGAELDWSLFLYRWVCGFVEGFVEGFVDGSVVEKISVARVYILATLGNTEASQNQNILATLFSDQNTQRNRRQTHATSYPSTVNHQILQVCKGSNWSFPIKDHKSSQTAKGFSPGS